ncbi:Helix-turn-helix domain (DUF4817) [Popillia japonica]|uniref:Helix-turn-helix domain (DUF4817) n=1 Tax=Popillia japonica TaxID=7064 RepID=A0AAW1I893_POPJA
MASYPTEVRVELIKYCCRNGESFAATARHLRTLFGRNNALTENTIKRIVVKFEATASAADERSTVRERQNTTRVPETIERINQPLRPDMERRFVFANEIIERIENGSMSLERVWWSDESHFDVSGFERIENGSMSLERVWWSDESHFDVSGYGGGRMSHISMYPVM